MMGPILTGGWAPPERAEPVQRDQPPNGRSPFKEISFLAIFGGVVMVWFRGRVARQRSAKPFTAVRIRSKPHPLADKMQINAFCPLFNWLKGLSGADIVAMTSLAK